MALRSFFDSLEDHITCQCPMVKSLVAQGYYIEKTKLIVLNTAHAVRIELRRQDGVGAVCQFTWEDPHLGLNSVVAAKPIAVARPAAASSPAASATPETTGTLSSAAPSGPLESAAPSAPPSLPLSSLRYSLRGCLWTSATSSTRSTRMQMIWQSDTQLGDMILAAITLKPERKIYAERCDGSGVKLLKHLRSASLTT